MDGHRKVAAEHVRAGSRRPAGGAPTLRKGTAEDSLTPAHTSEKKWAAQTGGPVSVRLTRVCSCGGGERYVAKDLPIQLLHGGGHGAWLAAHGLPEGLPAFPLMAGLDGNAEGWPALPLHLQLTNPFAPAWSTQGT